MTQTVQLTSDVTMFDSKEETTLQCSVTGGSSSIYNISLVKNGQVILNEFSSEISYTTSVGLPKNVYGWYKCIASDTLEMSSEMILLQNKGDD